MAGNILAGILPQRSFGGDIGQALGTGLGSGLQNLANMKLQEMQQRKMGERLRQANLPEVLAYLDPQVQAAYLREYGASQQRSQEEQAQQLASPYLQEAFQQAQQPTADILKELIPSQQPEVPYISQKEVSEAVPVVKPSAELKLKKELDILTEQLSDPSVDYRVKNKIQNQIDKKQEVFTKRSNRLFDKHDKFIGQMTKDGQDAKELADVIERQMELNEKGDMTTPGTLKFLEEIGLGDIDSLKSGDTQEFIKNNGLFMKNLKKLFGGRITDNEVKLYLRTIANEYQSPEGRRRVLLSLNKAAKATEARVKAMDEILKANGDMPTELFERDIEKVAKSDIDQLAREFKIELRKKPLPEAESKIATAAKALGGKALGFLPTAAKGLFGLKALSAFRGK